VLGAFEIPSGGTPAGDLRGEIPAVGSEEVVTKVGRAPCGLDAVSKPRGFRPTGALSRWVTPSINRSLRPSETDLNPTVPIRGREWGSKTGRQSRQVGTASAYGGGFENPPSTILSHRPPMAELGHRGTE